MSKPKVVLIGLPMCRSNLFEQYFKSRGYKNGHWRLPTHAKFGTIIYNNVKEGLYAFTGIEDYDSITQMDWVGRREGIFPQISILEDLTKSAPDVLYVLNSCDPDKHADLIYGWTDLAQRIFSTKLPGENETRDEMELWIHIHNNKVRNFFSNNPHFHFVEIDVYNDDIESILDFSISELSALLEQKEEIISLQIS